MTSNFPKGHATPISRNPACFVRVLITTGSLFQSEPQNWKANFIKDKRFHSLPRGTGAFLYLAWNKSVPTFNNIILLQWNSSLVFWRTMTALEDLQNDIKHLKRWTGIFFPQANGKGSVLIATIIIDRLLCLSQYTYFILPHTVLTDHRFS